jgi:hypothetical protein
VLELSIDDPVRRHVDQCPRCSSLLASYEVFIRADAAAGADPADAEARLMDFLQERVGAGGPAPPAPDKAPGDDGFFARLKDVFVLRPAWVAAALVVTAAAVLWWQPWGVEQPALRSTAGSSLLEVLPPETLPDAFYDLSRAELPADTPDVIICRVTAIREGDEVAETAPVPLELPRP